MVSAWTSVSRIHWPDHLVRTRHGIVEIVQTIVFRVSDYIRTRCYASLASHTKIDFFAQIRVSTKAAAQLFSFHISTAPPSIAVITWKPAVTRPPALLTTRLSKFPTQVLFLVMRFCRTIPLSRMQLCRIPLSRMLHRQQEAIITTTL